MGSNAIILSYLLPVLRVPSMDTNMDGICGSRRAGTEGCPFQASIPAVFELTGFEQIIQVCTPRIERSRGRGRFRRWKYPILKVMVGQSIRTSHGKEEKRLCVCHCDEGGHQ